MVGQPSNDREDASKILTDDIVEWWLPDLWQVVHYKEIPSEKLGYRDYFVESEYEQFFFELRFIKITN